VGVPAVGCTRRATLRMKHLRHIITVSVLSLLLMPILFVGTANAAGQSEDRCSGSSSTFLGLPTWYKYLDYSYEEAQYDESGDVEVVPASCEVNVNFPEDIGKIILALIEILLYLGGIIAMVIMLVGGFKYMTSQGNPDATKSARNTIQNAFIGLVISIFASVTVGFIARYLTR